MNTLPLDQSLEYNFDFDTTLPLNGQESCVCAHVKYRKVGARRWTRFLLVADPGESIQSLDAKIDASIYAHAGSFESVPA